MPSNYDEVVDKNRRNLTKAQIQKLAEAAQRYNQLNAGNRADAYLQTQQQYASGYRALQNMGLAGGTEAQTVSGEVPRLQTQVQTPFDQYNRKLQEVENKQLSALGASFAESTRRARDEARKKEEEAKAAAEESARLAAEAAQRNAAESAAAKLVAETTKRGVALAAASSVMDLTAPQYDYPIGPTQGPQTTIEHITQNAKYAAVADMLGVTLPQTPTGEFNPQRPEQPSDEVMAAGRYMAGNIYDIKNQGVFDKMRQQREAQMAQQQAESILTGKTTGYDAETAQNEFDSYDKKFSELEADRKAGKYVPDQLYNRAKEARDMAQLKIEQPKLYAAYTVIQNPNADPALRETASREIMRSYGYSPDDRSTDQYNADKKKVAQYASYLATLDDPNASPEEKNAAEAQFKAWKVTPEEARKFISDHRQTRMANTEYEYYKNALMNQLTYEGKTPTKPVNNDEQDPLYRAVNGLKDEQEDDPNRLFSEMADLPKYSEKDEEYERQELQYLSKEERDAYNYIYETQGLAAANKYIQDGLALRNIRAAVKDEEYAKRLVKDSPVAANMLSIASNTFGNVPAMFEKLVKGTYNYMTGYENALYIDTNNATHRLANIGNLIQSETSQRILGDNPGTSEKVYNFLYQGGMSMAQSAVAMMFASAGMPAAVDVLFFSSAGNEAYKDAMDRGATMEQAMSYSILSGAAEALFEHASIEHFMNLDYQGKGRVIKNMLSQAGAEASEEFNTELANMLTDAWVMRDKSQYNLSIQEYMKDGMMTKEQAEAKAFKDQLKNLSMASLGGAFSGLGFGVFGALPNTVSQVRTGKEAKAKGLVDKYVQNAALLGGDAAKMAQEVNDSYGIKKDRAGEIETDTKSGREKIKTTEASNRLIGAMVQQTNQQVKELADTAEKGAAVETLLTGSKLTTNGAQRIIDTLGAENLQDLGYDTSSGSAFAKDYNARLEKYGITPRMQETGKYRQAAYDMSSRRWSAPNITGTNAKLEEQHARNRQAGFVAAKAEAANRVWANPTQGMAMATPEGNVVTPLPGNMTAVDRAEQERTGFRPRSTATTGNVTYAVAGMEARQGLSNEQTLSEIKKGLTKEARQKAQWYEKLADALGVKMVIHDVMTGTNGFIDADGNMHVVLSGKQSVLRVAAHELTHWMKDHDSVAYRGMRSHLIAEVGQERFDRMMKQKAREYGIDMSTDTGKTVADDEVCAELCERMLSNEEALERFAEKDTAAAKTLKDHLLKILNAIKSAFKRAENRDFGESWSDLIQSQDTIESWLTGLQKAIEKANERAQTVEGQIAQTAGVTTTDQGSMIADIKSAKTDAEVDDAISEHSVDVIEYDMAGYRQDLVASGVMSGAEIDELFSTMNAAVNMVKAHRAILDFGAELNTEEDILKAKRERAYLPYKQNADPHYKLALDFSTLCRKRVLLQSIQERLQAKLGRALSQEETVAIRLELQNLQRNNAKEFGKIEVACALCYVEAARLKSPKVINTFLDNTANEMRNYFAKKNPASKKIIDGMQQQWKVDHELAPDATKDDMKAAGVNVNEYNNYSRELRERFESDNAAEKVTIDRAVALTKNERVKIGGIEFPGRETFLSASWLTKLKGVEPDIFNAFTDKVRSATRSKAQETDTFYSRGDIDMVTEGILRYANAESGFRHQSWSDFVPTHLLDTMASVIEMSTRKAKMHAYTKVPSMVRLLGKTGMMLNMSLIPYGNTGIDANGNLSFDSVEGMPWETMMQLRDMFPDTAGNIAIGINDEQIRLMLASGDIDYVIPYHASGMNKSMRGYMDIRAWSEYTSSQNEKSNRRGKKGAAPELADWFDEKAAAKATDGEAFMRAASEKYLQLCYERNLIPKFAQYLTNNGDGSYSLKEGYENYWKMLTDRKMVNQKTGRIIIQQAVKPTFDQDTVMGILQDRVNDPEIQQQAKAADLVTEKFSGWQANRNNADAEAIQEAKNIRDRTAAITAQKTAEETGIRYDIDTDSIRQAFTTIDTSAIEAGLDALKDVKHVGSFALKDISRFLDASAGKNKDLRNTLHDIFEKPHSEATGRYARGVERMQERVLDIAVRAGVVSEKDVNNFRRKIGAIRFDSKKSAAIQNIGEGFSNTYTDLKLKVKDAEHVIVRAYEPGTDKLVVSEKDYTLKELRQAYGTNAADYVWDQVFHQAEDAQATGGEKGWVEQKVNTRPYTLTDLRAAFPNDWQQLKAAADEFRQMYDEYIRDQNNMLSTIYPIESEYADVEKLEAGIEKKQERLVNHKAAVQEQLKALQEKLEAKEKDLARTKNGKKRDQTTDTARNMREQASNLRDKIESLKADLAEYEANVKDELVKMNTLKAEMQNAVQKGDYSLKRMHRLQYRSDYFHHFTEMASGIQNLKSIFTNNTDIAPAIVGKSEGTKAKTKWAGYFQQRMGGDYTADALSGMLRYGQLAEYKLAFDPLTAYLRDVTNQIASMSSETNRDGLIRYLQAWTDYIAGKSHKIDRVVSDAGFAPRKAMQILQWINSRVIQNTLLFNMRSAILQGSNITNAVSIIKNPSDWMNGLRSLAMAARGDEAMASIMAQSNFLASRYMDGLALTDSKLKSAKQFAGWMLGALDEISAKATWWAAYQQYTRNPNAAKNQYRSYESAVDYADDITRRTHAGRGVGELAPAMTSRVINFVAPFQVEVNNTWQLLKDNVKQKNFLGLLSSGLSVFLFNTAFEAIVGSTPLGFDFIRAVFDIVLGFTNDDDDDDPTVKSIAQRFAGELVGGLPFASQLVAAFGEDNAKKILGEDNDATRYGNTQIGVSAVMNALKGLKDIGTGLVEGRRVNWVDDLDDLLNLTMPMGGKQLTRTLQGIETVAKGYAGKYDKNGDEKVQFVTDGTILKYIHAGLFGKWALTEASEYFGEKRLLPQLFGAYDGPKSSLGAMVDAKEYKAALATGIGGKDYFTLKSDLKEYTTQPGMRAELMQKDLTPEQKAKLDELMIVDKKKVSKTEGGIVYQQNNDGEWEVKADYTNQDMFDLSTNGNKTYTNTVDAMEKTGLPQDQASLAADMWEQTKDADDRKAAFRDMLRDNKNLTVDQKEALDLQYTGNKYPADYSDPDLYELSTKNRTTYEKAKQAKEQGIPVKQYVGLYDKKKAYSGKDKADYMRTEIMNSNLSVKQKELLDDLLVSDKGANPDYSSQAWFDLSMLSKTQYDKAKDGAKVGVKPEVYLAAYKKYKEVNRKEGDKYVYTKKEAKALLKAYMDKLPISAPAYDYIWSAVFGYMKR